MDLDKDFTGERLIDLVIAIELAIGSRMAGVGIGWSGPSWYWKPRHWFFSTGRVWKSFHVTLLGLDLHFHWNR